VAKQSSMYVKRLTAHVNLHSVVDVFIYLQLSFHLDSSDVAIQQMTLWYSVLHVNNNGQQFCVNFIFIFVRIVCACENVCPSRIKQC